MMMMIIVIIPIKEVCRCGIAFLEWHDLFIAVGHWIHYMLEIVGMVIRIDK